MLFRRIKTHIENENWFAVGIDFAIVVLGVFIGIQVANWNEARSEKQAERKFLERLYAEIMATQDDLVGFSNVVETRASELQAAAAVVFGNSQEAELTGRQCVAMFMSHAYNFPPTDLPTIGEILSSGQFNVISDDDLRTALSRMGQINTRAEKYADLFNASPATLARAYPDLIRLDYVLNPQSTNTTDPDHVASVQCDLAGMRVSQAFKNDLTTNVERYNAYQHMVVNRLGTQFDVIHAELDRVLGHSREEDQP